MTTTRGFSFKTDEVEIVLGGVGLELYGEFLVSCDDDGLIQQIDWAGGSLTDNPYQMDRVQRALFVALDEAISTKCADRIAELVSEGTERHRERAADRRAELVMGK